MGRTYKKERTVNKARKSRAVERTRKETGRVLGYQEMLDFIDCCHAARGGRACNADTV